MPYADGKERQAIGVSDLRAVNCISPATWEASAEKDTLVSAPPMLRKVSVGKKSGLMVARKAARQSVT